MKTIRYYIPILLIILLISGCSTTITTMVAPHTVKGKKYIEQGEWENAIREFKLALDNKYLQDGYYKSSFYLAIGASYAYLNKKELAYKYFYMSAKIFPPRAYYAYDAIAWLNYDEGKIEKALENIKEALKTVQYHDESKSEYSKRAVKNSIMAKHDFYQLMLKTKELRSNYHFNNFSESIEIADKLLDKNHKVYIGLEVAASPIVRSVIAGGIADLNGIIVGDKILEVDGTKMGDGFDVNRVFAQLTNRLGQKTAIKILRKGRVINVVCHLYYPEIDEIKNLRSLAKKNVWKTESRDSEKKKVDDISPEMIVLTPKNKRAFRIVHKDQNITFSILAADNKGIEKVLVNNIKCSILEPNRLERNMLFGKVKKYTTNFSPKDGENVYIVKAIDFSGNIVEKKIVINYNRKIIKKQKKLYDHSIAVVIGINKYDTWPPLEYAVSDAVAIKEKLHNLGFEYIIEIYDTNATRQKILRVLGDELPKILGENDRLMIFFAGHGQTETLDDYTTEGYIIPVNGDTQNYSGTAISMSQIHDISQRYKAKHILYAFDSCYSGLGLKRSGGKKKTNDYLEKMGTLKAVQIITAGGKDEQAGEEKGHGIFTRYLLFALGGKADIDRDGFVTASEIGQYIRPAVSKKTDNKQTPLYGRIAGEGDYIFDLP